MPIARLHLPILALLALAGCAIMPRPADPIFTALVESIRTDSATFFAGLSDKQAPDCALAANTGAYDHLAMLAKNLKTRIYDDKSSPALVAASDAMLRTIDDARASHAAASANTGDSNGPCLAPGAIALNADAIARASAAIAAALSATGGR